MTNKKSPSDAASVTSVASYVSRLAAYDDLFERMVDAVLLLDIHLFSILDLNNSCARILGENKDDMIGRALANWLSEEHKESFVSLLTQARDSFHMMTQTFLWQTADQREISIEVSVCSLTLSNQQQVIQVIGRDVSVENELRRRTEAYLEKLEYLSLKDELTGLSNYRHFQSLLQAEHRQAETTGRPYSILFLDVDHFKLYNDRNGHPAGDEVLRELGKLIRANCRATDHPARYGGEEFAILSIGTDKATALRMAERVRASIEAHPFAHGRSQPLGSVSMSIGVASYPGDAVSANLVVSRADEATYRSKRGGRNRVTDAAAPCLDGVVAIKKSA